MNLDWNKIGIVTKTDFDRLEEKVNQLIAMQEKNEKVVKKLNTDMKSSLKELHNKIDSIEEKSAASTKGYEHHMEEIDKTLKRFEEVVKLSLINNLFTDIQQEADSTKKTSRTKVKI
ncbi:hypothetical protein [Lysinibacillus sp. BW-2-10]|uniref:hypothetical protein n=1 Tax=Lysinibacillus sp. BW-2-10 TaxID=2590030 RepID=UPI0011815DDD|nr:hypothetical protein [Lysinibacillus sp. BW-2-10]TSI05084.1 hypothetical protein FJQ64_12255 [Lysinibacillus sp. BW-2-10]